MDERSLQRFMRKVQILPNGCWQWTARPNDGGYGTFSWGGKRYRAHRASYEHFVGPIPDRLEPDHTCHSEDKSCPGGPTCVHRLCVNWEHLELVTRRVNALRGRSRAARNAAKTHCKYGHPFDEANTYYPSTGGRQCRACNKRRARERQALAPKKGRKRKVCPKGHPYEGANVAYTTRGTQRCRQCARDRQKARYYTMKVAGTDQVTVNPAITHCPAGHELTPANSYFERNGRRRCRECRRIRGRERQRRWRARQKEERRQVAA